MRKFIYLFLLSLWITIGFSQGAVVFVHLHYESNGVPVTGSPTWVMLNQGSGGKLNSGVTDNNGNVVDSLYVPSGMVALQYFTLDCNGNYVITDDTINTSNFNIYDTININCPYVSNCSAIFTHSGMGANPNYKQFQFSGVSTASPNSVYNLNWSFGSGINQPGYPINSPIVWFGYSGQHNVCLTVTQMDTLYNIFLCNDTYCDSVNISGTTLNCNASFTGTSTAISNQYIFQVDSPATGLPPGGTVHYNWSFLISGSTDTGQTIIHTIPAGGDTVQLQVVVKDSNNTNVCGSYTYQYFGPPSCTANFSKAIVNTTPLTLQFLGSYNLSPQSPDTVIYQWDFGDANHSLQKNPIHTYSAPGNYTVCMIASSYDSVNGNFICEDTICQSVTIGVAQCSNSFTDSVSLNDPMEIWVKSQSTEQYINLSTATFHYDVDWGDGSAHGTTYWSSHTYSTSGNYTICLNTYYIEGTDTICFATTCKNITVGSPTPPSCSASYIVDTANSYFGQVYIWNTSQPAYNNPNYSISYYWDFGDGSTSTQPFPVHSYSSAGIYAVCLSITVADTTGIICSSAFCDTLGTDSLGNLIYKNSNTGFTLNVLNPATIGIEEHLLRNLKVYPNPASDEVVIEGPALANGPVDYAITDLKGATVMKGNSVPAEGRIILDVSHLSKGMYIISLLSQNSSIIHQRLLIDRR